MKFEPNDYALFRIQTWSKWKHMVLFYPHKYEIVFVENRVILNATSEAKSELDFMYVWAPGDHNGVILPNRN